jgi:hypothetical protein
VRARRILACTAACVLAAVLLPARAQIVAPEGWRKETFAFPLAFAPSIPYEGTEHVRFSPWWSRFETPQGFSYVVLWDIRATPMEGVVLERALEVYFDGLMNSAADARHLHLMVPQTAVVLHPMAAPAGWNEAYAGAVHTWNAFTRGETLVLNAEIADRPCGDGRMQVFYAFSRAPRTDPVWESLRGVRQATPCAAR